MKLNRRKALALMGLGAAQPAAAQRIIPEGAAHTPLFSHGVASGDPLQDRVVIWTRISSQADVGGLTVLWQVAKDPKFANVVAKGRSSAEFDRDLTIKTDVAGLQPGTSYFYRFRVPTNDGGFQDSPTGRTRTLPAGPTKDAVIATVSCALYPNGYFNAYRAIADLERVDLIVHLGDYIYEYGGPGSYGMTSEVAGERPHDPPHELLSLADYRRRHAQYKSDPDLQAAHARAPWVVAWDDHETANDSYKDGAENHQPDKEGQWSARKAAALKAYYEWMPIREPAKGVSLAEAGHRSFQIGDLASLIMLETRLTARDKQLVYERDLMAGGKTDLPAFKAKFDDPARRMMSPGQEAWLGRELAASVKAGRAWQVIGSGVVMGRLKIPDPDKEFPADKVAKYDAALKRRVARMGEVSRLGLPYGLDMWDGYPVDRERVYDAFKAAGARPIVISGDSHAFWANELKDAKGKRVACEFGGTAVTSPGADEAFGFPVGPAFAKASDEVVFCDQGARGFVLLTITRDGVRGDLMGVSTITSKSYTTKAVKSFRVTPEGKGLSGLKAV